MKKTASTLDTIKTMTARNFAHTDSEVIQSHRRVLEFQVEEIEQGIARLEAKIVTGKQSRDEAQAQIDGLNSVLSKR